MSQKKNQCGVHVLFLFQLFAFFLLLLSITNITLTPPESFNLIMIGFSTLNNNINNNNTNNTNTNNNIRNKSYPSHLSFYHEHVNDSNYNWCHWYKTNEPQLLPMSDSKIYTKMLSLLDLLKYANLSYTLEYGTLLGAIRNGGIIEDDGDIDVQLLIDTKAIESDPRFDICKQKHCYEQKTAHILYKTILEHKDIYGPFDDITMVKNAYDDDVNKQIVFTHLKEREWFWRNTTLAKDYLLTLSLGTPTRQLNHNHRIHLYHPYVMDIGLIREKESDSIRSKYKGIIEKYGKLCDCTLHNKVYKCLEFSHLRMLDEYGDTYMTPSIGCERCNGVNRTSVRHYSFDTLNPEFTKKQKEFIEKEKELRNMYWESL